MASAGQSFRGAEWQGITPEEAARRIRVARAYAGLSQAVLAQRLGLTVLSIKRWEGVSRPARTAHPPSLDQLYAVADVCGVPRTFMVVGFASATAMTLTAEEAHELAAELADQVVRRLGARVESSIHRVVSEAEATELVDQTFTALTGKPQRRRRAD